MFVLVLLAGCATGPTMDELETRAFISGDWSLVEKRERALARRQLYAGPQCPHGYIAYCEERFGDKTCSCVKTDAIRALFSNR
jgi:hypothetical protein